MVAHKNISGKPIADNTAPQLYCVAVSMPASPGFASSMPRPTPNVPTPSKPYSSAMYGRISRDERAASRSSASISLDARGILAAVSGRVGQPVVQAFDRRRKQHERHGDETDHAADDEAGAEELQILVVAIAEDHAGHDRDHADRTLRERSREPDRARVRSEDRQRLLEPHGALTRRRRRCLRAHVRRKREHERDREREPIRAAKRRATGLTSYVSCAAASVK